MIPYWPTGITDGTPIRKGFLSALCLFFYCTGLSMRRSFILWALPRSKYSYLPLINFIYSCLFNDAVSIPNTEHEWYKGWWTMNGKGCGRKWSWTYWGMTIKQTSGCHRQTRRTRQLPKTGWTNLLINSESRYTEGLKVTTTLTGVPCNIWITCLVLLVHIKRNMKLNLDVAWTMCFQTVTSWIYDTVPFGRCQVSK